MIDTGLEERVAVVTGANHGIGAAIAVALAAEGARVLLAYLRQSPEVYGETPESARAASVPGRAFYCKQIGQSAERIARMIRAGGGDCLDWEADLADPATIPALFERAEKAWGQVDVVVNNAAFDSPDTFLPDSELADSPYFAREYRLSSLSALTHDAHFAVNSRAVALMMAEYARRHIARDGKWGRIINITTDGAHGHPSNVSYGASKLAIESFSRAAAAELGPYGITVNVVSPGAVQTGWIPEELEKAIAQSYPLRRIGHPEDIADAVVFFASRQADWITGQVLQVGGGHRM